MPPLRTSIKQKFLILARIPSHSPKPGSSTVTAYQQVHMLCSEELPARRRMNTRTSRYGQGFYCS